MHSDFIFAVLAVDGGFLLAALLRLFFFFNDTAPPEISTLPLHHALPISHRRQTPIRHPRISGRAPGARQLALPRLDRCFCRKRLALLRIPPLRLSLCRHPGRWADRKSTRLNSSHQIISYAVFCFKKKKTI